MTELAITPHPERPLKTGIVSSLFAEIADALARFAETGEIHKIDLRSLPMTEADRTEIDERLGVGEVRADLAVIGRSEVWETAYAGVWRVRHYGALDAIAADEVVIASAPDILFTHRDDARAAAKRLKGELADGSQPDDNSQWKDAAHA